MVTGGGRTSPRLCSSRLLERLLQVVQALQRSNSSLRLLILSRGLQFVGWERQQAPLWQSVINGLCRSLAAECSGWTVSHVDMDAEMSVEAQFGTAVAELAVSDKDVEVEVCYRDQRRLVARACHLEQHAVYGGAVETAVSSASTLAEDGSYLVTGGLSGLGLATAGRLVARGCKQLVLCGRRLPDEETQQRLDQWRQQGVEVIVKQVDMGQEQQVAALLQFVQQSCRRLRGVVHSAGALADDLLAKQDWQHFEQVFRAKVYGAWYLHEWSQRLQMQLEFFVLYSSMSSYLGNVGQANYASANSFLDSLAQYRRSQGLVGQSIQWGPWAEVGMSVGLEAQQQLVGLQQLTVAEGLDVLEWALSHGEVPVVAVMKAEWRKFKSAAPRALVGFLKYVSDEQPTAAGTGGEAKVSSSAWVRELLQLSAEERRQAVESKLVGMLTELSSAGQQVDVERGFMDLGVDSLAGMGLWNQLQQLMGEDVVLPSTVLFDYPSIRKLSEFVSGEVEKLAVVAVGATVERSLARAAEPEYGMGLQEDAVAVVGMSGYFPAAGDSLAQYWQLLVTAGSGVRELTASRFSWWSRLGLGSQRGYAPYAGLMTVAVDTMDADFFKVSGGEAKAGPAAAAAAGGGVGRGGGCGA